MWLPCLIARGLPLDMLFDVHHVMSRAYRRVEIALGHQGGGGLPYGVGGVGKTAPCLLLLFRPF